MLWLLIIVLLGSTIARCPNRPPKGNMRCKKELSVCFYPATCRCNTKTKIKLMFKCIRRRWQPIRRKRTVAKCKCSKSKGSESKGSKGSESKGSNGCICNKKYMPVCAANGKTYNNICRMICQKKKLACKGKCPCKTKCQKKCDQRSKRFPKKRFVCGTNGKTYNRPCRLVCAKTNIRCKSKCRKCVRKSAKASGKKRRYKKRWG